MWGHPHVIPSPIQSCFTSQLSILFPYSNQHTDLVNSSLTTTLSLSPSLSTSTNKGNGPWQAELPSASHARQLCQPANGRAGWPAVTCIKEAIWPAKRSSFGRSNCPQHISRRRALQDYSKIVGSMPCPVTLPRELGLPPHTVSSRRPATAPATSCQSSPWPSGQDQPRIKQYTIARGWPDVSPWQLTTETPTERTSRFSSGRFFMLHTLL